MNTDNIAVRDLTVHNQFSLKKFLAKWEMILIYILLLINFVLMIARPNYYFAAGTIPSIIQSGMDLSFMVLGMVFILMLGDIDVSVAAIMIVSGMVMGLLKDVGANDFIIVFCGLAAGALCGLFNGVLVAKIKMPAVIVTIATSLLFRGIVMIILDVNVLKHYPHWFQTIAWANVFNIPVAFLCFLAVAAIFAVVLHRSRFGRELYMIGNSPTVSAYSGINVDRVKITVFVIMGLMAGVSAIFFVGRMGGGLSSTMGKGYELNVIAIAVLGGVSTSGGKGRMYGPVIATLIMAFLSYTMGLLGVDANSRQVLTGLILILAVLIPNINVELLEHIRFKLIFAGDKNIEAVNLRCREEIRGLQAKISEIKKSGSLPAEEKQAKIRAYTEKIFAARKKCKQTSRSMKEENRRERLKAKRVLVK